MNGISDPGLLPQPGFTSPNVPAFVQSGDVVQYKQSTEQSIGNGVIGEHMFFDELVTDIANAGLAAPSPLDKGKITIFNRGVYWVTVNIPISSIGTQTPPNTDRMAILSSLALHTEAGVLHSETPSTITIFNGNNEAYTILIDVCIVCSTPNMYVNIPCYSYNATGLTIDTISNDIVYPTITISLIRPIQE